MSMQPRRREILRIVGTACLVGNTSLAVATDRTTGRGGDTAVVRTTGDQWVATVSAESAAELLNTQFEFWSVHGRAAAILSHIIAAPLKGDSRSGWSNESFQLVFHVTESTRNLPRDLCNVIHPRLGSFELFIQNSRTEKGGDQFTATFGRLP